MRWFLSRRARPAATFATLLLVATFVAPTAALASAPDHSNAGGTNGGNNGVACDDPPAGGGNPGQGNAGQGNAGGVGNVCDDDRDPAAAGDGSGESQVTDDPDDPDTDDPDTDDPDTDDPDTDDPDTDDPAVGTDLCDDLLVTLSPTATDGNDRAVAITSQTLEAGVPGWAAASWEAASGTTLTAVFARTAAGDVSLPPTATGSATYVESLTFCGTTSGDTKDGAPEEPAGSEPGRGTTGGDDEPDLPTRPAPGPDTTPGGATPPATSTTSATPASTAPASAPAASATAVEPTEDVDEAEVAEVLVVQLAATDTSEAELADTDAPAAVTDVVPIADEREGSAGLVGGGLALAALIGLLLLAWRRRSEDDTQEVTA